MWEESKVEINAVTRNRTIAEGTEPVFLVLRIKSDKNKAATMVQTI